jgi:cytosine/adenosine deaminase-related metal-dependent hydrolase
MTQTTTVIRNSRWLIAWDEAEKQHVFRPGTDLAFRGNEIIHCGPGYDGPADKEIDGRDRLVMPGLVNIHSHPMSEPMNKGYNEELGSPALGMSGLYEYMPIFRPDAPGTAAGAEVAYCELLLSGVTTLIDISVPWDGWQALMAKSGLRGVLAPMFRSARWYTPNGHEVLYEWDEAAGRAGMEGALNLIERAQQDPSGRLGGMLLPSQIDTCTEELLREASAEARQRGLQIQIHASQSVVEFNEITRRHGLTPIQWLDSLGFLGENTTIAHGIFLDHHSWVRWPTRKDLDLLADSGTSVAHCPNVFVRRGILLEHLGAYLDRGINVGIGTDTFPHNMLDEMRWAGVLGHVAAQDVDAVKTGDVFHSATIGGANIVGRDDIGRLAVGAKADLVLADTSHPYMMPSREPLRNLIYSAQDRAVRDVFVDGRQAVADGKVLTMDHADAAGRLDEAQRRTELEAPKLDWAKRPMDEIAPPSLPIRP